MSEENIVVGPELERILDSSLGELALVLLKGHGSTTLQIDANTGEKLSGNLIVSRAIKLAKWFTEVNVGVGDSVSIISENRLEFSIIPVAAFCGGITFAPLNPDYTPGELKHVLNLSKPKVIFASSRTIEKIKSVMPDHPYVKHLVYLGKENVDRGLKRFDDIIAGATEDNIDELFEATPIDVNETVATILCSSGTTGLPKGVMCTHDNMVVFLDIARVLFVEMLEEDRKSDVAVGLIPFFHSMGFMTMFLNLLGGKLVIVISKFNPRTFLNTIVTYKISTMMVPPPVLVFLLKHPLAKEYDLTCLKEVLSGAAPMGRETEMELKKRFKVRKISQSYGMTETTLGVIINPQNKPKIGSVGTVVPGMMAKIVDEDGRILGPNQEGELCLKGPLIMKGYVGDDASTNNCIDTDNWLHTGDVAYYDTDRYFFIVDRLKELIKYKAYQVAPAELEALLLSHPDVQDAAVIGLPDEDAGELPLAYVVKETKANVTEDTLKKFVAEKVSPQKQLRGGVIFISEIPRNPTGKILRRVLRDQVKQNRLKSKL